MKLNECSELVANCCLDSVIPNAFEQQTSYSLKLILNLYTNITFALDFKLNESQDHMVSMY